ncbi:hypothetical protein [Nitrosopumilus sp. S6]
MNKIVIPLIASILILGGIGLSYDVFADRDSNNGNNGCEKSNPNAKSCEKNPNAAVPTIDPTSGPIETSFTITDPQGRIQQGDVVIFYEEFTDPQDGITIPNFELTITPDGTQVTGEVPVGASTNVLNFVSVTEQGASEPRFDDLPFFVTSGGGDDGGGR